MRVPPGPVPPARISFSPLPSEPITKTDPENPHPPADERVRNRTENETGERFNPDRGPGVPKAARSREPQVKYATKTPLLPDPAAGNRLGAGPAIPDLQGASP